MEDLLIISLDTKERDLAKSIERAINNNPTEIDPIIV